MHILYVNPNLMKRRSALGIWGRHVLEGMRAGGAEVSSFPAHQEHARQSLAAFSGGIYCGDGTGGTACTPIPELENSLTGFRYILSGFQPRWISARAMSALGH